MRRWTRLQKTENKKWGGHARLLFFATVCQSRRLQFPPFFFVLFNCLSAPEFQSLGRSLLRSRSKDRNSSSRKKKRIPNKILKKKTIVELN